MRTAVSAPDDPERQRLLAQIAALIRKVLMLR
jgi:hypothetical protein